MREAASHQKSELLKNIQATGRQPKKEVLDLINRAIDQAFNCRLYVDEDKS